MNIIFKPFEEEENWPHLIEMPREPLKYQCEIECYIGEICACNDYREAFPEPHKK